MSSTASVDALVEAARRARQHAHAPYSKFRVGAALEDDSGRVFTGCNIENATFGLTLCAERVAIFKAMSEGARRFRRIAVCTDTLRLTPPCGACRQILWEFAGDIPVTLCNLSGDSEIISLSELMPRAFDGSFI